MAAAPNLKEIKFCVARVTAAEAVAASGEPISLRVALEMSANVAALSGVAPIGAGNVRLRVFATLSRNAVTGAMLRAGMGPEAPVPSTPAATVSPNPAGARLQAVPVSV